MLLYHPLSGCPAEDGGHGQGRRMDRAGPAAARLYADHGADRIRFPLHTVQLFQVEMVLSEMFRGAAQALNTWFRFPYAVPFKPDNFLNTLFISKIL